MRPLCLVDAEKAKARGRQVNPVARNRGPCGEPGCEEIGLYILRAEPPNQEPETRNQKPETRNQEPLYPEPEPEPRSPRRNGAAPIPCDQTGTCPHCLLSRISPVSAYYMPAPPANPEPQTRNQEPRTRNLNHAPLET